jgi:ABC-2 type transport system permease protein
MSITRDLLSTLTIAGKDLRELWRSKIRLFTLILMPLILISIFGYMFPSGNTLKHISVGIVQLDHGDEATAVTGEVIRMAASSGALDISSYASIGQAEEALIEGRLKGILIVEPGFSEQMALGGRGSMRLIVDQTSPTISVAVSSSIAAILGVISTQLAVQGSQNPVMGAISLEQESIVPGAATNTFEFMAPGFLAMMVMMGGMGGLASALSRERELGTLDGMMMSPISRFSVIFGKALSQTVRGLLQGLMMILLTMILFGVKIYGNPITMLLVLLLGVLGFVGIGIIATSIASEQESATMILMMLQIPMMFLSGVLYPIEQLPWWMQMISKVLPLTYAVTALRKVMVLGAPLAAISSELSIMIVIAVVTIGLAIPLFQRAITK